MLGSSRLRVIVSGLIAQYPLGGITWHYLQYVLGLARLGHDVYYVEDTGQWPYNPRQDGISKSCEFNVRYLDGLMKRFGLAGKWAYRFVWGPRWFGMSDSTRASIVDTADLVVNVSGTLERPREYRRPRSRLVYVDTDPVFTQIKLARGQHDFRQQIDAHDVCFTFGECLKEPRVPPTGHRWLPTRQPIVLSEWSPGTAHREVFTTVMNWTSYKPVSYEGRTYGQKDVELRAYLDLPSRVSPTTLELAVASGKTARTPRDLLSHRGWQVVSPAEVCPDLDSYRSYIESSKAEWSVAKNGYVRGRAGWFSERSACYLAAGKPVVLQDTGFTAVLPAGAGLLAFNTPGEAVRAIAEVEADYGAHAAAARSLAEDHFDSAKVLTRLVEKAIGDDSR